jgi:hypothetical protein
MASGQASEIGVVLPPNDGAEGGTTQGGIIVRAIVVGDNARALVDLGGTVRILGVGDAIGDQKIAAITSRSVTLGDGTSLPLVGIK